MKKFKISIKKSRRNGQWYWVMYHGNGEKMANSEPLKNHSHVARMMITFKKMGFVIDYGQFKTKIK